MGLFGELMYVLFSFGIRLLTGVFSYVYQHAFSADGWNMFWVAVFFLLLFMVITGGIWLYMYVNFFAFIIYPLVLILLGFVLLFLAGYAVYLLSKYIVTKHKMKGAEGI
ncbi:hypothetical protein HB904_17185 [Listeria booriae]|uniref:Uncharacterized protein n=1 Tax=Listeria booriae TaxID=1552123 RepID=A0A842AP95_9LIST|nr:hypothetical protein [Listeria booriae]MBC1403129.1 hypothetical protein [Listeria booriae]MBC1617915.1 hypothetical protein [Listeria booriae]